MIVHSFVSTNEGSKKDKEAMAKALLQHSLSSKSVFELKSLLKLRRVNAESFREKSEIVRELITHHLATLTIDIGKLTTKQLQKLSDIFF